jgi:tetratricopeptide (TPR) repeat protein
VRRLYTPAMMADVLSVSVAAVRHWVRGGLLVPLKRAGSIEWFDFPQLVIGRQLVRLHSGGLSLRAIDARLQGLSPGGAAEAARMGERIIADGLRLSIRRGNELLGAGGQRQFAFYTAELAAADELPADILPVAHRLPSADGGTGSVLIQLDPAGRNRLRDDSLELATTGSLLDLAADLEAAGEYVEAAEALRALLQAEGPSAEVSFMLAELLYRLNDLTAARERYYAAVELDQNHLEARSSLGCVLAELGEHELAVAALEGVLRQQPDYADAHWHMAGVLFDMELPADASRHLRAFLALAPESPWADLARQRLADTH